MALPGAKSPVVLHGVDNLNTNDHTTNAIDHDDSVACYRLHVGNLIVGIIVTAFFLAVGVAGVTFARLTPDDVFARLKPFCLALSVGWLILLLPGIWIIVAHFRVRLMVSARAITKQGCIGRKTIAVGDLTRITWKRRPKTQSITVASQSSKMKIDLGGFGRNEREELIQFFHETFDQSIQEGWADFILPPPAFTKKGKQVMVAFAYLSIVLWLALAAGSVYLWTIGRGRLFLGVAICNLCMVPGFLWAIRMFKKKQARESSG